MANFNMAIPCPSKLAILKSGHIPNKNKAFSSVEKPKLAKMANIATPLAKANLMDVANLLYSLTTQGLRLSLGQAPETIAVVGPVASLTLEQQRALAEHKQTLLSMLTPPPTCYIPDCGEAEEREAIQFANSDSPEVKAALCDAMEYFELLTDARGTHCPERLVQIVDEPGQQESPCKRCGNSKTYLAILHTGESLRRDCAICGRFVDFPNWHNREATAKILAAAINGSRYNEKASCPSAGNTQASSNDLLSLKKETANG